MLLFLLSGGVFAQQGMNKVVNPYHEAYHDSLRKMDYPYTFPLLGKKAYKKGFDIPYAWGISPVYYAQRQDIAIPTIAVGLNDGPLTDISGLVQFGRIENKVSTFTFRPDLWVLPFLNIYGIFGFGKTSTEVPLVKPIDFTTVQNFNANSAGFGFTFAGGIGPVLIIIDNNFNWADVEAFVEPVPAYNFDARLGHNFVNPRRADRSVAIWFGTFYQKIKADTDGHIPINSLFPDLTPEETEEIQERLNEWVEGLPPAQEVVMRQIIQKINDYFEGREPGDNEIHYVLDKRVAGPWNLVFGAQYQHNKNWQIRSEIGTFGKRTQFLLNLNYRFPGFRGR
jgi:hypothetical protein